MSLPPPILALCGSTRTGSFNRILLEAATRYLESKGAACLTEDLKNYDMPIYSGDIEAGKGIPAAAVQLREKIDASRAIVIATPEYNGSVTPLLKNVLDWTSRPYDGFSPTKVFQGKVVCLMGASLGDKGALRGLAHLSSIFLNMGSVVVPRYFGLSFASKQLDENSGLTDQKAEKTFRTYLDTFLDIVK